MASFVNVYVYSGTGRSNLTTLIEANSTASVGAPYITAVDDGAVIVAYAIYQPALGNALASFNGTFKFSY